MKHISSWQVLTTAACMLTHLAPAAAVEIKTVAVLGPNVDDPYTGRGSVSYNYRIGQYEVTNGQYAAFLNAVGATDSHSLFDPRMESGAVGGISRSGSSGNYSYQVKSGRENNPVVFVDFFDAIRFANWLNNGQGTGDTETGAYDLSFGNIVVRNPGSRWFLPSENEWYKAAYYDPSTTDYYRFATRSDTEPISEPPPGGNNSANVRVGLNFAIDDPNHLTDVGSYAMSASAFGTYDQTGNVWEWTDEKSASTTRIIYGGGWMSFSFASSAGDRGAMFTADGHEAIGFRVATFVPEPSTLLMLFMTVSVVIWRNRSLS